MKNVDNITNEDIKRVLNMSEKEIEQRLSNLDGGMLKGIIKGLNGNDIKKNLGAKNPDDMAKLLNNLSRIDPSLIKKIKDVIK